MAVVAIRFDLRVPSFASTNHAALYEACLDQCTWAEDHGLDVVVLSEHHGVEDGYLPAPLTLAAAICGRTRRIALNIAAALVPLHDPVRFAEQVAVIDLLSGSRLSIVAGIGYRQEEFDMVGIARKDRGRLFEEHIEVMRKAWTGEPFEWRGRTIRVTPKPRTQPPILIGGSTEKAARRAARLHCGFFPSIGDPKLAEIYNEECAKVGYKGGFAMLPGGPGFVHIAEDPEREWELIAPHALYDAQSYAAWQPAGQRSSMHVEARTVEDLKRSGVYCVVTPDECIALAEKNGRIVLHPLMGGIAPEVAWRSLKLFEQKVLPKIR